MSEKEDQDYPRIKERLHKGELTKDDIALIEGLLGREGSGELGSVGGRPIVAHLPNGMDVIK